MIMPLGFTWDSEMFEGREHEQTMAQSIINNNYNESTHSTKHYKQGACVHRLKRACVQDDVIILHSH